MQPMMRLEISLQMDLFIIPITMPRTSPRAGPSPKVWTSNRFTEEGPDFEKKEKILKKVRTREEKTNAELACKLLYPKLKPRAEWTYYQISSHMSRSKKKGIFSLSQIF